MDPNAVVMLDQIDAMQDAQDAALVLPLTALNQSTVDAVGAAQKSVNKLLSRILQRIDRETTTSLDALDGLFTTTSAAINQYLMENEFLVGQLAVKGGLIEVGNSLESALQDEAEQAPQLLYASTLYQALEDLKPMLRDILEVWREIRDRMPPLALHVAGERPAQEPSNEPDADTDVATLAGDPGPLEQPPTPTPIVWS